MFPELLTTKGINKIQRYRLAYNGMARQMETVQAADYTAKNIEGSKAFKRMTRKAGVLHRNVLVDPILYLAFSQASDAEIAAQQHLCLCRNEDLVFPVEVLEMSEAMFSQLSGFELRFGKELAGSFLVGYNRYHEAEPMYGRLDIFGDASQYQDYA